MSEISACPSASQVSASLVPMPGESPHGQIDEENDTLQPVPGEFDDCMEQLDFDDMPPMSSRPCGRVTMAGQTRLQP